jgi:transcriptional regulator with XRE-family HTH domain
MAFCFGGGFMDEMKKVRLFEKKVSQFELSRITRIHPSRISLIENDLVTPTSKERQLIAAALGADPEKLFGPDLEKRKRAGVWIRDGKRIA